MYSTKQRVYDFCARVYMHIIALFFGIKKQVLFESFMGKQYSDNPRAISEKLHDMFPQYGIVWAVSNSKVEDCKRHMPSYVRIINKKTIGLSYLKEIATSFCYVTNENLDPYFIKRKKQFFVQTYHGDRGFKRILYEAWPDGNRPKRVMDEFYTDLAISGSSFAEKKYPRAFHYYGDLYLNGTPRNDCLINPNNERVNEVKTTLGISKDIKILLYAPTFRDNKRDGQKIDININRTLDCLNSIGGHWICLVRGHSLTNSFEDFHPDDNIFDVSDYYDMADLLMISDMLITDYSSCACDFSLTYKPIILAAFDIDDYKKNSRDFIVDPEEPGFLIAKNQEELEYLIMNSSNKDYYNSCKMVNQYFGTKESGNAAEDICGLINQAYCERFRTNG